MSDKWSDKECLEFLEQQLGMPTSEILENKYWCKHWENNDSEYLPKFLEYLEKMKIPYSIDEEKITEEHNSEMSHQFVKIVKYQDFAHALIFDHFYYREE